MRWLSLILLMAFVAPSTVVADDNIVIVFDTSGSMNEYMRSAKKSRLEVAKEALNEVLSKLPESTNVGIISFGNRKDNWTYPLGKVDKPKLAAAINKCSAGGGTPLYEYMSFGASVLLEKRKEQNNNGFYKLLVVTDGVASDESLNQVGRFNDGETKPGVLSDIVSRSLIVDAIGLDMAGNHPLSTQINGIYMRGDDSNSLKTSIRKAVAEIADSADVSNEAFEVINQLPENFVGSALKGLTTFENHPIGEKAPIVVVQQDGTLKMVTNPTLESTGSGGGFVVGIIFFVVIVILLIGFVAITCNGRGY